MQESWAVVDDFPNYLVSNYGQVYNQKREGLVKPRFSPKGYAKVILSNEGYRQEFYIHQLVAQAFFGYFYEGLRIAHVNGDLQDNILSNLQVRRAEQEGDRDLWRQPWGRRILIVETGEIYRTARDCARHIGGDFGAIYACLRGERNRHMGYTFRYYDGGATLL